MLQKSVTRTVLLLFFAVLAVGSIGFNFQSNIWQRANRQSMHETRNMLAAADIGLADLRAAEAAYLSVGQGVEVWMARANDISAELGSTLSRLQSATRSADAGARYDAALSAMKDVAALDTKARNNLVSGQSFMASDVVFMDGLEANRRVGREVAAARQAEEAADSARVARLDLWPIVVNGGALVIGLVIALLLRRPVAAPETVMVNLASDDSSAWTEKKGEPFSDPWLSPGVDLSIAAELCVDLARVLDERDLPALLGRAAALLNAKGLVLWVADTTAGQLRPSLHHGYPEKVIQRMGVLATSADNVTSIAFRTMTPQTIRGSADGHGAIAVPLVSSSGCVGVLSAELQGPGNSEARAAVARMIAAQLATLVSPVAASPAEQSAQA